MSSPIAKRKNRRKQFSLKGKVNILYEMYDGKKQINVSREHGIPSSTITMILNDRDNIMQLRGSQLAPTRKWLRLRNFQEVDAAVLM